jgi:tetratricopeptide (TPR) repeat protein
MTTRRTRNALALVLALACAACAKPDNEASRREAMTRGDRYAAQGRPREAIIEYRKAIQIDRNRAAAHRKLAQAYMDVDDPARALESFSRAADLDPRDTVSQIQAIRLLIAGGEFERARWRAQTVVSRDPKNVDAQVLLGHALAGLGLPKDAVKQMEEAITIDPSDGRGYTALGAVQYQLGANAEAEAAFRQAVEQAPSSSETHLALASYLFAIRKTDEAEREFQRAQALAPDDELTNRAISTFYVSTGRASRAEPYLVEAAAHHAQTRLALADYYMNARRLGDAERTLEPLRDRRDLAPDVMARLAAIRYAEGKRSEAHAIVDDLLDVKRPPARALVLKGRFLMTEGKSDEALGVLQRAVAADPNLTAARFALGRLLVSRHDEEGARAAFEEMLRRNPHATAARLELSELAMRRGDARRAVKLAEEAATDAPSHAGAQLAFVHTLRAAGDNARAETEVARLLQANPRAAVLWVEQGSLKLERADVAGARTAFTRAMTLDPRAIEPLAGLMTVEARDGKVRDVRRLASERLAADPGNPRVMVLAARAAALQNDGAEAERLLQRAVQLAPSNPDIYALLGQLYIGSGRLNEARTQFSQMETAQPVAANTMMGLIDEAQGRRADAATHYERALKADPQAGLAANNLAWLRLGEGKTDEAVRLARIGQQALPERPEMNDTLGWMLHQAGRHTSAIQYLTRTVGLASGKALYQYHLGMAYLAAGDALKAQASLKRALALDGSFPGHEDARNALAAASSSLQAAKGAGS